MPCALKLVLRKYISADYTLHASKSLGAYPINHCLVPHTTDVIYDLSSVMHIAYLLIDEVRHPSSAHSVANGRPTCALGLVVNYDHALVLYPPWEWRVVTRDAADYALLCKHDCGT